jgi:transposase
VQYGDRVVFIISKKDIVYDNEMFIHVILDPSKKSKDTNIILKDQLYESLSTQQQQTLNDKMKTAGFFILLSRQEIDRTQILPSYYARQAIEQIFGFAKSNNNILPLRVHDEKSIRGYLMLAFLVLIIFITMRQKIKSPMDKTLLTLRSLKAKIYDDTIIIQEPNKKTQDILKTLNIIMPTSWGI